MTGRVCRSCGLATSRELCIECREKRVRDFIDPKDERRLQVAVHLARRFGMLPDDAIRASRYVVGVETRAFFRGKNSR